MQILTIAKLPNKARIEQLQKYFEYICIIKKKAVTLQEIL